MDYEDLAQKSLDGQELTHEECRQVLRCPQEHMLELLQAAYRVRREYFGNRVLLHMLLNAKSGLCSEDCAYCSQSAVSRAPIDRYPLLDEDRIVGGARAALAARARRFCIVTSGAAPSEEEIGRLCAAAGRIKSEVGIDICTSLGYLTAGAARSLKAAGVNRYNHNINTSERHYAKICSTHSFGDRMESLRNARGAGLELCCGVLFGMGESEDDVIEAAKTLRKVKPDSIPVNFLHPVDGTPLGEAGAASQGVALTPLRCLALLSLVRLLNPSTEIRAAGGREHNLRSLQPLALYPANSLFVSGYLTTSGQSPQEAWSMIEDAGFQVQQESVAEAGTSL